MSVIIADKNEQKPFIELLDKILSLTQCNTGIPACDSGTDKNVYATTKHLQNPQNKQKSINTNNRENCVRSVSKKSEKFQNSH